MNFIKKYFVKRKIKKCLLTLNEVKEMSLFLKLNGHVKESVQLDKSIQDIKNHISELKASIS
jgi:adenylate cyclase class IV